VIIQCPLDRWRPAPRYGWQSGGGGASACGSPDPLSLPDRLYESLAIKRFRLVRLCGVIFGWPLTAVCDVRPP
jgi:hypothetical protein